MKGMPNLPPTRSVKISDDERGGWSSDRPRRDGAPPRPADVSVRNRTLAPAEDLRYSPGSLLLIVSASTPERDRFAERLIENQSSLLSLGKVRGLLAGRVAEEDVESRATQLLDAAVLKRLDANETVVIPVEGLEADERERYVRMAAALKRPRHLILLEVGRDQVEDEDRVALNELRRRLDAGELGADGFHTALRLGGQSVGALRRIVFKPLPRED